MNLTPKLGYCDTHRRTRLLELAAAVNGQRAASLAWPDHKAMMQIESRDLPVTERVVTLGAQLRHHSSVARTGATFITLPALHETTFPTIDRSAKAVWSDTSIDLGGGTVDISKSIPRRISAYITVSKQLAKQSPILFGAFVEAQLLSAVGNAIDHGALSSADGHGLLNDPDVATYEMAGATPTPADCIGMERALADNHGEGDPAALCWLVDPATRALMRDTPRAAGISTPLWPDEPFRGPLGYRGVASPWAPANTTVFGRFEDLIVIQSGTLEIQPNPFVEDTEGFIRMLVNGYFDILPLNPDQSFIFAVPAEV